MLEDAFGAIWSHSPSRVKTLLSKFAYWVCEELDGYTGARTTCTKLAAGDAIALVNLVDIDQALRAESLPLHIESALASFTLKEWEEVIAISQSCADFVAGDLAEPPWRHLRNS